MRKAAVLLLLVSCSDNGLGGNDVSQDVACSDFVKAICTQVQTCSTPLLKILYGDEATCELRLKPSCLSGLKDPGSTLTTNRLDACAKKLQAETCNQTYEHVVPDECKATAGSLADGKACGDDYQCQSAYCNKAGNTCGVCGHRGTACVADADCESGFVCFNKACVQRAAMGATCSDTIPCDLGLYCGNGTCQKAPGAGEKCMSDSSGGNCDKANGLVCNPVSGVCQPVMYANSGEACGIQGMNFFVCTQGSTCTNQLGGNCRAPAADGAACDAANGPTCELPAACTNSLCTLPDTSTCK